MGDYKELGLDSRDLASFIIKMCMCNNLYINITKLQRMMYAVYGTMLALHHMRICKEHPKAMPYGPAFLRVNNTFALFSLDVLTKLRDRKGNFLDHFNEREQQEIVETVMFFGGATSEQLFDWAVKPEGAWAQYINQGKELLETTLPDNYIEKYFKYLIEENAKANKQQQQESE